MQQYAYCTNCDYVTPVSGLDAHPTIVGGRFWVTDKYGGHWENDGEVEYEPKCPQCGAVSIGFFETVVYCDGSIKEICFVIETEGAEPEAFLESVEVGTSNQSEYLAVIAALQALLARNIKTALILSDSQLIVNQINGDYTTKNQTLRELRDICRSLIDLTSSEIRWIPREDNHAGHILEKRK